MSTVLVVDDKEMMRDSVGSTLQRAGFTVISASDGAAALGMVASRRPAVVVTDLKMPGMTGIELLERLREVDDELPVVVMTAFGTIDTAVRAMKLGAFDYITKPFEGDEMVIAVKRAVGHGKLLKENAVLRAASAPAEPNGGDASTGLGRIIGDSPAMRRVKQQVIALAGSQGTVLVCGESGSGKEVIAQAVHELSPRSEHPFLAVNCAALSESLLESELFGHERGAFTGADRMRKGRFELADGGTLLLDEVSEVGLSIQAKLLRVLQERAFERVGSSTTIGVDARVVATSNRDLPRTVSEGGFRQDLFFRLNVLPIHLPPLRDRLEDVPVLARHFTNRVCAREGRASTEFAGEAMDLLCRYDWPGNVRELQNICERAVVLSGAAGQGRVERSLIEPWLLPGGAPATSARVPTVQTVGAFEPAGVGGGPAFEPGGGLNGSSETVEIPWGGDTPRGERESVETGDRTLEEIERDVIVQTLIRMNGHRQRTAKSLGIGVRTLGLKLKKWKEAQLVSETL